MCITLINWYGGSRCTFFIGWVDTKEVIEGEGMEEY
jgi:hypothetical protein